MVVFGLLIPILLVGGILMYSTYTQSMTRFENEAESENIRVRQTMDSITSVLLQTSLAFADDAEYRRALAALVPGINDSTYVSMDTALSNMFQQLAAAERIMLYTDNPNAKEGDHIEVADLSGEDWYEDNNQAAWWCLSSLQLNKSETVEELTMVRRISVGSTRYHAFLVIWVSDDYLRNVLLTTDYDIRIAFEGESTAFFDSGSHHGGEAMPLSENPDVNFDNYTGTLSLDGESVIASSSLYANYATREHLIILTSDTTSYQAMLQQLRLFGLIIVIAIVVPGLVILLSGYVYQKRLNHLRDSMHRASLGDYNISDAIAGGDELADTYRDLEVMTEKIRAREKEYYDAKIKEQELVNRQQEMEFKMLASQINPHFLYNTLEMIRMQALSQKDRSTASSILILSQMMHYVLENIGTQLVPLSREIEQVERYLKIQQLRFGDRVTWDTYISEDIDPEKIMILPLMLQPIVENAVNYGVEPKTSSGHVTIIAEREQEKIHITVRDNGAGMDEETLKNLQERIDAKEQVFGKSIGLANVNLRIRALYGEDCGLKVRSVKGKGTSVEMVIRERES